MTAFQFFGILVPLFLLSIEIPVFKQRKDVIDLMIIIISVLVAITCTTIMNFKQKMKAEKHLHNTYIYIADTGKCIELDGITKIEFATEQPDDRSYIPNREGHSMEHKKHLFHFYALVSEVQ